MVGKADTEDRKHKTTDSSAIRTHGKRIFAYVAEQRREKRLESGVFSEAGALSHKQKMS